MLLLPESSFKTYFSRYGSPGHAYAKCQEFEEFLSLYFMFVDCQRRKAQRGIPSYLIFPLARLKEKSFSHKSLICNEKFMNLF